MPPSASDDSEAVRRDFAEAVTMAAGEPERRLETGEPRSVGQKAGLTEEDLAHMRRWRYSLMNCGHDPVKEA